MINLQWGGGRGGQPGEQFVKCVYFFQLYFFIFYDIYLFYFRYVFMYVHVPFLLGFI